ncbi:hypothetical protein ABT382_20905 [Streptomyces pharetrae]|uniref:hypothetical protein n=1 Tax=Streptomyces pharetrae TaxID=291370 RepID=UPI00335B09EF
MRVVHGGLARLNAARERVQAQDRLRVDHHLFLLEDINRFPVPTRCPDAEIIVVGPLAPQLGFTPWQQDPSVWPVTVAPANEAVHAAKAQSYEAAEPLDMALRLAYFREVPQADDCGKTGPRLRDQWAFVRLRGP